MDPLTLILFDTHTENERSLHTFPAALSSAYSAGEISFDLAATWQKRFLQYEELSTDNDISFMDVQRKTHCYIHNRIADENDVKKFEEWLIVDKIRRMVT